MEGVDDGDAQVLDGDPQVLDEDAQGRGEARWQACGHHWGNLWHRSGGEFKVEC